MVFELKAIKHQKLKVEKSNLTMSCIYKIAQVHSTCYTFCCKHMMKHLTTVKITEPKLPFITENFQIYLKVNTLTTSVSPYCFSYQSHIYLNKNLLMLQNMNALLWLICPKGLYQWFFYPGLVTSRILYYQIYRQIYLPLSAPLLGAHRLGTGLIPTLRWV